MERFAEVYIREKKESKRVRLGSRLKPTIIDEVIDKWQTLLNLIVKVIRVPSGLIMKLNEDTIEVFLSSNSPGNPYKKGEKEKLVYGLYCETAIGLQKKFHIPDATKSPLWKENNPDVKINMISYLGYPVNWPDGEVFGTICILDKKENHYNEIFDELLLNVKNAIETDLQLLLVEQQLEKKNAELEQELIIKDKFFSIIAHDLKSPFNSILGFSQLLVDQINEKDYEGIDQYARIMQQSSERVMNLLINLLEWARLQNGKIQFQPENFDLIPSIEETVEMLNEPAIKKEITIKMNLPENLIFYADKHTVNLVLRNLISNAIKFTRNGGEIIVSAAKQQNEVIVSVKDDGVGIPQDRIDKLFRVDESDTTPGTAGEKGTGLGLILCKEFVKKNEGRIWVESNEGIGSKFSFALPLKQNFENINSIGYGNRVD